MALPLWCGSGRRAPRRRGNVAQRRRLGDRLCSVGGCASPRARMRLVTVHVLVAAASAPAATLDIVRDGSVVRTLDAAALKACARPIELEDPYYEAHKRFSACPLATIIEEGFGVRPARLEGDVVFRARDGYA